jgi:hypothetical protein
MIFPEFPEAVAAGQNIKIGKSLAYHFVMTVPFNP